MDDWKPSEALKLIKEHSDFIESLGDKVLTHEENRRIGEKYNLEFQNACRIDDENEAKAKAQILIAS